MRTIEISTNVFSRIWALRQEGEETESAILDRLLGQSEMTIKKGKGKARMSNVAATKVLWRDDIIDALNRLGGEADLAEIYAKVEQIRSTAGRSLPESTDAVIRRELENNSSDSESFTGHRNLFRSVNGIGGGRWAIR